MFLFSASVVANADWVSRELVSSGSANVKSFNPAIDVADNGDVHIAWSERRTIGSFGTYYRQRSSTGTWTTIDTVHDDSGIERLNDVCDQQPDVAVNRSIDKVAVVFLHRNADFYLGTEQGCIFYNFSGLSHLHTVSGMAEHAKDPFIVFNPYLNDDFIVFWSQHDKMSDDNHDIYYNYQATETVGMDSYRGWQFVDKASNTGSWSSQFGPAVAINNSEDQGTPTSLAGEMYLATWDYAGLDGIMFTRYDVTNGWQQPQAIANTANADDLDIAYYYDVSTQDPHILYLAYRNRQVTPKKIYVIKSIDRGSNWTSVCSFNVSDSPGNPAMDVDSAGNFYVAFAGPDYGVYVRDVTASPFTAMEVVQNCKYHKPVDLKIDTDDDIHVVYSEREFNDPGEESIYWTKYETP